MSLIVALVNAVMGTVIAWVLVRDHFPGQRFVDAIIDLPFALPTIVAGLTLLALYGPNGPTPVDIAYTRTAVLVALLFVTLPFVVRTVQPVLIELDREMEEAAASLGASSFTIFRRVVFPILLPGDPLRRRARVRPGDRRVRRGRPDHRQPPVQDRGRVRVHLRADRERRPDLGGRGLRAAARGLARGSARHRARFAGAVTRA